MKKELSLIVISSLLVAVIIPFSAFAQVEKIDQMPTACQNISFTRNLSMGMMGGDVKCLQAILNLTPETQVAAEGPGSKDNETEYFGPMTQAAVVAFQEMYVNEILAPLGLSEGTGYVGQNTMMVLNEMLGVSAETGSPPQQTTPPMNTPPQY